MLFDLSSNVPKIQHAKPNPTPEANRNESNSIISSPLSLLREVEHLLVLRELDVLDDLYYLADSDGEQRDNACDEKRDDLASAIAA
jgi:hypothetical protein